MYFIIDGNKDRINGVEFILSDSATEKVFFNLDIFCR